MKVLALVLLCIVAAAQARSTALKSNSRAVAELGENPWVVHLRIAVSTSGLLDSCAGSLIDQGWVLTATACVENARFIWIRYGVINVLSPELVTEASVVRQGPSDVSLISIRRVVHTTANIAPVALATTDDEEASSATFCRFENIDDDEILTCSTVDLEIDNDEYVADVEASRIDLGASLVSDSQQIAVLVRAEPARFTSVAGVAQWIEETIAEEN